MDKYMAKAIEEARLGIINEEGGPFGAVIVREGKVISRGHNKVVSSHDPTAHAEIVAIRAASKLLERFDLSDCVLYTTCEPCPMCLAAALWAKITTIYYGADRKDAAEIGFEDDELYEIVSGNIKNSTLKIEQLDRTDCLDVFKLYENDPNRVPY